MKPEKKYSFVDKYYGYNPYDTVGSKHMCGDIIDFFDDRYSKMTLEELLQDQGGPNYKRKIELRNKRKLLDVMPTPEELHEKYDEFLATEHIVLETPPEEISPIEVEDQFPIIVEEGTHEEIILETPKKKKRKKIVAKKKVAVKKKQPVVKKKKPVAKKKVKTKRKSSR